MQVPLKITDKEVQGLAIYLSSEIGETATDKEIQGLVKNGLSSNPGPLFKPVAMAVTAAVELQELFTSTLGKIVQQRKVGKEENIIIQMGFLALLQNNLRTIVDVGEGKFFLGSNSFNANVIQSNGQFCLTVRRNGNTVKKQDFNVDSVTKIFQQQLGGLLSQSKL